jgi:hypothetical protein
MDVAAVFDQVALQPAPLQQQKHLDAHCHAKILPYLAKLYASDVGGRLVAEFTGFRYGTTAWCDQQTSMCSKVIT